MDATTWLNAGDYRLFKDDRLVQIDTTNGNKPTYDGKIAGFGTYVNLPPNFKRSIDATTWVNAGDYRLFKGDQLVVIDTATSKITYNGPIAKHGTYANVPSFCTT